jgi:hypothetical protein
LEFRIAWAMTLPTGAVDEWLTRNLKFATSSIWVGKLKLKDLSLQGIQSDVAAPGVL